MCACGLRHESKHPCDDLVKNGWMQTLSGKAFCRLDPRPGDVTAQDIARGLSTECRYNGQTREPYTVAQHSVLVVKRVEELLPLLVSSRHEPCADTWRHHLHLKLAALLHDAAEAYLKDIPRSLKRQPAFAAAYGPMEAAVERVVFEAFGVDVEMLKACGCWPGLVKNADEDVYEAEVRDLMRAPGWFPRVGTAPAWRITPWSQRWSETTFLSELGRLMDALDEED